MDQPPGEPGTGETQRGATGAGADPSETECACSRVRAPPAARPGVCGAWRIRGGPDHSVVTTRTTHPAVAERLGRLAADQRAAATAPPGPVLCVAPAGSGK